MTIANFPSTSLFPSPTLYPGAGYYLIFDTIVSKSDYKYLKYDLSTLKNYLQSHEMNLVLNELVSKSSKFDTVLSRIKDDRKIRFDSIISKLNQKLLNYDIFLSEQEFAYNSIVFDTKLRTNYFPKSKIISSGKSQSLSTIKTGVNDSSEMKIARNQNSEGELKWHT